MEGASQYEHVDRAIHLRRVTERMSQTGSLSHVLSSLFSSDVPLLFLLILSIYYSFSLFLSHSILEHASLVNLKDIPRFHIYSTESSFDCTCLSINDTI